MTDDKEADLPGRQKSIADPRRGSRSSRVWKLLEIDGLARIPMLYFLSRARNDLGRS